MSNQPEEEMVQFLHMYVIVRCMIRMGWEKEAACEALGLPLPEDVDPNEQVPVTKFFEICHKANEAANDPLFCLKLGTKCHPIDYGILGKLAMFSETIGSALELIFRYQGVINGAIKSTMVMTETALISPVSIGFYDPELVRPHIEFRLAAFMSIGHFATGAIFPDLFSEVCFQHSAQTDPVEYRKVLGTMVRFDQPRSSFSMPLHSLKYPVFCADADIMRVVQNHAQQAETSSKGSLLFADKVKEHIRPRMFKGIPSQEDLAEQFGMSTTKFKRLLSEENTNYRELCCEVRENSAAHLLLATNQSIAEIGIMVGFSQPSSFVRSFKSWTGVTPQQYRHQRR